MAVRRNIGHPLRLIAAICRTQVATLATRNTKNFTDTGIEVIDPWQETFS